ncbi:MAG: DoxX family protein [Flavobacteriales bacterium]
MTAQAAYPITAGAPATDRTVRVCQFILFFAFLALGAMRLLLPIEELAALMKWPGALPAWAVRGIGALELAGAIGVLVPSLTGIAPRLSMWAAFGLLTLTICAIGYHLMLFQGLPMMLPSIGLGALAAYVGVRML